MFLHMDGVWSISKSHIKILETIEFLMNNNKRTSVDLLGDRTKIQNISNYLCDLIKLKFIKYEAPEYKLTISGMDCIAINCLRRRGLEKMGSKIGIGKESDIYYGEYKGVSVALKFHRLGRTSFRTIKNNRDYTKGKIDWFKINKISCVRERKYIELFKELDVPQCVDSDRHVLVLELLDFKSLYMIKISNPEIICEKMISFIRELWVLGYVHGDFNEFNVFVEGDNIKVIDFPQCLKKDHEEARIYVRRDIECVQLYFKKKYGIETRPHIYEEIVEESF